MTELPPEEEWREIPDTNGIYWASNLGRIKRTAYTTAHGYFMRDRVLSPSATGDGHLQVGIFGRLRTVHSLVMLAWKGPRPPGLLIRHLDDVPSNNVPSNLEYGTARQNAQDVQHRAYRCKDRRRMLQRMIAHRREWTYAELGWVGQVVGLCPKQLHRIYQRIQAERRAEV